MELFRKYQKEVKRTVVDLGSLELNLSHMVLGIISENEEYLKAIVENDMINAKEEQADMLWYLANYCNFRGFNFDEIVGNPYSIDYDLENFEEKVSVYTDESNMTRGTASHLFCSFLLASKKVVRKNLLE